MTWQHCNCHQPVHLQHPTHDHDGHLQSDDLRPSANPRWAPKDLALTIDPQACQINHQRAVLRTMFVLIFIKTCRATFAAMTTTTMTTTTTTSQNNCKNKRRNSNSSNTTTKHLFEVTWTSTWMPTSGLLQYRRDWNLQPPITLESLAMP